MKIFTKTPTFLARQDIDDERWNQHIRNSLQGVAYAFTFYLDAVCESWEALVWRTRDFTIVMPLPIRRKWDMCYIYQPLFCQYLGIFSDVPLQASQVNVLLGQIFSKYRYISAYHFHPHNSTALLSGRLIGSHIQLRQMRTYWLHLNTKDKNPVHFFTKDRRTQLQKGRKKGWGTRVSMDAEPLITLFEKHHAGNVEGGVHPLAYDRLRGLFTVLQKHKCAEIRYAVENEKICAGIMLVRMCGTTIYLFNAANEAGRRGHARTCLLTEYFQNASGSLIFDFESPEIPAIAKFYEGFGAEAVAFYGMRRNALNVFLRAIRILWNAVRVRKS